MADTDNKMDSKILKDGKAVVTDPKCVEEDDPSDQELELEVVTCTIDEMTLPTPLSDVIAAGTKFRIVSYDLEKYNELDIMSIDGKMDDDFHLNEDIFDVVECGDCGLQRLPEIRDVVLAPKGKDYRRAVITRKVTESEYAVYFVDAGGKATVTLKQLKPVTKAIMNYPILAHHVTLQGVKPKSDMFVKDSFAGLMTDFVKEEFTVELGSELETSNSAVKHDVIMSTGKGLSKVLLNDAIENLKVWEWERYSRCTGNDDEVCKGGAYGGDMRSGSDERLIVHYYLELGTKFNAVVTKVVEDEGNPEASVVTVTWLDDPEYRNYLYVLHCQMQRYAERIKPSPFFPALNERFMFKLVTTDETLEKYKKLVKVVDEWCRAVRIGEMVYLFDVDETIPFLQLPQSDYQMRRIYGEFFKIPILAIKIRVKRHGNSVPYQVATQIFKHDSKFAFEITNNSNLALYEAEFSTVKKNPVK